MGKVGTGSGGQLRVGEMRGREGYAEEGGRRERGRWKRAKRRSTAHLKFEKSLKSLKNP